MRVSGDDLLKNQTDSTEKSINQILKRNGFGNLHLTRVTVVLTRYDFYRETIFTDTQAYDAYID